MAMVPLQVHTAFMELQEMSLAFEFARKLGFQFGSIQKKKIRNGFFFYYQFPSILKKRQVYLFPVSEESQVFVSRFNDGKAVAKKKYRSIKNIAAMVKAGGMMSITSKVFKVIKALSDSGVFTNGGVLVGTHAFIALCNLEGMRLEPQVTATKDIDFAFDNVTVASSVAIQSLSIPNVLEALDMGFVPSLPAAPIEDLVAYQADEDHQEISVEFLTPRRGNDANFSKNMDDFNVRAQQVRFLDYLIEETVPSVLFCNSGSVHVRVPIAARFAFHKLIVAGRRDESQSGKIRKDIAQSRQLFEHLMDTNMDALHTAREALEDFRWLKHVDRGLGRFYARNKDFADRVRKVFYI